MAPQSSTVVKPPARVVEEIQSFVKEGIDLKAGRIEAREDPFWKGLKGTGTELWLDTGDLDEASKLWTKEFSALTTNNTLLNAEVQKGIYDDLVGKAAKVLSGVDQRTQVIEIGFILNARHGLRLAQRFGGKVSVELSTELAHDLQATLAYARRYYAICPEHFIVKIPLTPAGLVATRTSDDLLIGRRHVRVGRVGCAEMAQAAPLIHDLLAMRRGVIGRCRIDAYQRDRRDHCRVDDLHLRRGSPDSDAPCRV